jgi:hypothetical protein
MRTLQEKYNGVNEGAFSKDQFLRDARLQLPNLVTRFNGYDDAVQILKNRGMIQEAMEQDIDQEDTTPEIIISPEAAYIHQITGVGQHGAQHFVDDNGLDAKKLADYVRQHNNSTEKYDVRDIITGTGKGAIEGFRKRFIDQFREYPVAEEKRRDPEAELMDRLDRLSPKQIMQLVGLLGQDALNKFIKYVDKNKPESLKEARLTNKSLTDYRYKATNDMDKYPYEQILRGLRVELEGLQVTGTPTAEEYKKALAKVLKNLEKDEIFYTNQVAGISKKVDLHDKMVDVKKDNAVDTFNGLKKAQLKEGFKKLIKNILKENSEISGLYDDEEKYEREEKYGSYEEPVEDEEFELQEAKEDSYYKSELADYLEDNQIYGYTDRIHDIMTGPDEAENIDELIRFLEDNQIYGYGRGIEAIYADYPYDQHWMNQPDEAEDDDISHPRGYEEATDEENFDDLFEETDTEADKNMVRKFMTMYETEPSKFERLHKQAATQADTNKGIEYKHLLSLLNRAKAGALKSLSNQDRFEADREGINEESDDDKLARYKKYKYTLDGKEVSPNVGYFNNYLGADLDDKVYSLGSPDEKGVVALKPRTGKTGMYTESIFETVSLKDIL